MIVVNKLCFDYPGKRALDHVSFTIEPNTITALVGPNGAGKTTLLRCLAALEFPMNGSILINDLNAELYPRKVHEICSYLPDFYGLYDELTVEQHLRFFAWSHLCPNEQVDSLTENTAKQLELTQYLKVPAGKLSRGLRQRLAIAQTIIHQPKILLLDEPAAGLDPKARYLLSQLLLSLQKSGMTIVVSSHILSELEDYSTHMLVIENAKLIEHCALRDFERKHGKEIILQIDLTAPAQNYAEVFNSIPNIIVKSMHENTVLVIFKGSHDEQKDLLKTLIEKQLPVLSIHEQKQSLQEVYLNLDKKKE